MKCPKCSYHSFDHLDNCKKCGHDLSEHKAKFNLRGFYSPGQPIARESETSIEENDPDLVLDEDGAVDFGFDFLDEEAGSAEETAETIPLGEDDPSVNIDQPFGVDSETVPADDFSLDDESESNDKPGKGPEFAF